MTGNRIVYQNWIVDLGHDPESEPHTQEAAGDTNRAVLIQQAVKSALNGLDDDER